LTRFSGQSSVEVAASPEACFDLVCDTPRTPTWHEAIRAVEILERDADGRTSLVRAHVDALVATVALDLRLSYQQPGLVRMLREGGDLRDFTATWTFDQSEHGQTRAGFEMQLDPGRGLSLLARGPLVARLRTLLAEQPPLGLKRAVERANA
jgi:ribosome-associated toxin RatA of RatAB toxin-antitoxin module